MPLGDDVLVVGIGARRQSGGEGRRCAQERFGGIGIELPVAAIIGVERQTEKPAFVEGSGTQNADRDQAAGELRNKVLVPVAISTAVSSPLWFTTYNRPGSPGATLPLRAQPSRRRRG
jgi:hypothetical protein